MDILANRYVKYSLGGIYCLALSYFFGYMLIWLLPNLFGLAWPYSLIPGYALGLIFGVIVTFIIWKRLPLTRNSKIAVAISLFVLVAILSFFVVGWMSQAMRMRAIDILGVLANLR